MISPNLARCFSFLSVLVLGPLLPGLLSTTYCTYPAGMHSSSCNSPRRLDLMIMGHAVATPYLTPFTYFLALYTTI